MSIVSKNLFWENEASKKVNENGASIQYARVHDLSDTGEPILIFPGEVLPSKKIYVRLKSYVPNVGDRIMILNNIIIGGWDYVS